MTIQERNLLRDKTLILRILDERLQSHLREKMAELEKKVNKEESKSKSNISQIYGGKASNFSSLDISSVAAAGTSSKASEGVVFDLDGVTCEPAIQSSSAPLLKPNDAASAELLDQYTLWNFHCDGATYPARLVNMPLPIEVHKTQDHAAFYKCTDIAQMLIVYEDMTALEEAESTPGYRQEAFPSYYHSGITPPMKRVVQKRFMAREHSGVPPPMNEVIDVEKDLMQLIEKISMKDPNKRPGRGNQGQRGLQTKVLEEIEDEYVEYEPWMENYREWFDEDDAITTKHPELYLDATEIKKIRGTTSVDVESNTSGDKKGASKEKKKKKKTTSKKADTDDKPKKKKKKKKGQVEIQEAPPAPPDSTLNDTTFNLDETNMDNFDLDLDLAGDDFDGFGDDMDLDGMGMDDLDF
ncbi:hypothetical protein CTEN210_12375 [Chaetoceros tenuissimus]|uniref:TAFII55 protein conserved region domain-containing protein n=1 Tax=Chaetoceros tenuissimus TaxID=426638 RepID=A0AAD3D1C7_9STRA|nr:hypothetical protein CTEN210_12375 [Chaetoceros tenuissimus]